MEVMFAVVILTLGMIFVSAQFPLGLDISRQASETTTSAIDTHNAVSMLKIHLGSLDRTTYFGQNNVPPNKYYFMNTSYLPVTNFYQPNKRVDLNDFVMDDPAGLYFPAVPVIPALYGVGAVPRPPDYIITQSTLVPTYRQDTIFPRNIGQIVSPPVDLSDRQVQQIYQNLTGSSPTALQIEQATDDAIYQVAMERTYSWCTLYQCLDPPASGGPGTTFRFFIYTLRRSRLNSRYAMQDYTVTNYDTDPKAWTDDQDRVFPVPWYINLSTNPNPMIIDVPRIPNYPDRFPIDHNYNNTSNGIASIVALLRPGSFIIDLSYGYIYQILEIQNNATFNGTTYDYVVRLRTNLKTSTIRYLSVVPPDIVDRSTTPPRFGDNQPVVNVTQQVIRF